VRPALKVVMHNDWDFVDIILIYLYSRLGPLQSAIFVTAHPSIT
jgi:hypothetical protein